MKKFYFLTLAVAVAFSASARYQLSANPLKATPANAVAKTFKSIDVTAEKSTLAKAPTAGATLADYEGEYTFSCLWGLSSGYAPETLTITVDDATTGAVSISGFPQNYVVKGTLDLNAGTLSLPNKQNLGVDSYGDINYFYIKAFTADYSAIQPGATSDAAAVGTINGNTITFPEYQIWAIADYDAENLGYWFLTMTNVLTYGAPDPNEGWEDFGEATFQDGWVLPFYDIDQTKEENHYKVKIQASTEYPGTYRLVNPYQGNSPVAKYNTNTKGGYIEFDIADPDHVYFLPVGAGFGCVEAEISDIYCYNTLTWYCLYYSVSPTDVVAQIGDEIQYATYKNGVLTVPYYFDNYLDQSGQPYGWTNDAVFGIDGDIDGGYNWNDQNGQSLNQECKIFFEAAGVESTIIDTENAPKEYFNLQGVRVVNPENGVYIVRQGSKTTKQYIR